MSLLPFQPQHTSSFNVKPKVKTVSFADGYEQRFLNEIHSLRKEYQLTFTLTKTDGDTLLSFLENLKGINNFQWQGPDDAQAVNYVCQEWTYTLIPFDLMQLQLNIRRVYEA